MATAQLPMTSLLLQTKEGIEAVLNNPAGTTPGGSTAPIPNSYLIYRMLQAMYARQTADEQSSRFTKHTNSVGFNKFDADYLSKVARQSQAYKDLSPRQAVAVARLLRKYVGQLVSIAQSHSTQGESSVQETTQVTTEVTPMPPSEEATTEEVKKPRRPREKKAKARRYTEKSWKRRFGEKETGDKLVAETSDKYYFVISFPEADIANYEEDLKAIKTCSFWNRKEVRPENPEPIAIDGQTDRKSVV